MSGSCDRIREVLGVVGGRWREVPVVSGPGSRLGLPGFPTRTRKSGAQDKGCRALLDGRCFFRATVQGRKNTQSQDNLKRNTRERGEGYVWRRRTGQRWIRESTAVMVSEKQKNYRRSSSLVRQTKTLAPRYPASGTLAGASTVRESGRPAKNAKPLA